LNLESKLGEHGRRTPNEREEVGEGVEVLPRRIVYIYKVTGGKNDDASAALEYFPCGASRQRRGSASGLGASFAPLSRGSARPLSQSRTGG